MSAPSNPLADRLSRTLSLSQTGQCSTVVEEAPTLLRQANEYRQRNGDLENTVRYAQLLSTSGHCYAELHRHEQAEPLLADAIALFESSLGKNHVALATPLQFMANTQAMTGRSEAAVLSMKRAEAILEQSLAQGLSAVAANDVAASVASVGDQYLNMFRFGEAERLYQRALEVWQKALGANHPNVAAGLTKLALLYNLTGDFPNGERAIKRSLDIAESTRVGTAAWRRGQVATAISNLGSIYQSMGRLKEAEAFFLRALDLKKNLGDQDTVTKYNLGQLYSSTERDEAAVPMFEQSLASYRRQTGDQISIAAHSDHLARSLGKLGETRKAQEIFDANAIIFERNLPPGHPQLAKHYNMYGEELLRQSRFDLAREYLRKSVAIYKTSILVDSVYVAESTARSRGPRRR